MNTEKSDVCGITGFFVEGNILNQAKYFGGFLSVRTSPNQPRKNVFSAPFNSFLVDCYGMSEINGEINPHKLEFIKLI